jgi:3-oxoacyl-[acyl-carrier-protein] synthase III
MHADGCAAERASVLGLRGVQVVSVGVSLPEKVVPSSTIAQRLGVSAEWIVRRTGIRARRVAATGERLSEHAARAARRALARAGVAAAAVDLVLVATVLGADGAGAEHIFAERSEGVVRMRGHETFREAVARLSLVSLQAARAASLRLDEIDLFVYHQANGRILAAVGERLGLPEERVVDCIGEYGNTSAATLPLTLAHCEGDGRLVDGTRVLLGAFGAGFTWGATVLEWGRT